MQKSGCRSSDVNAHSPWQIPCYVTTENGRIIRRDQYGYSWSASNPLPGIGAHDRTPNDRYQLKSNLAQMEPSKHGGTAKWSKVNMQTSVGCSDGVKTVVIPELVEVVSATTHATWEMSVQTTS